MTDARILTGDARVVAHTNYCRQAIPHLKTVEQRHQDPSIRRDAAAALNAISIASKFIIPSGRAIVDSHLRGLDGVDELCLPFPVLAIESTNKDGTRVIVLATQREDVIAMQSVYRLGADGTWRPSCMLFMPRRDYAEDVGSGIKYPRYSAADPKCPDQIPEEASVQVLALCNALACANVHIERSPAKKGAKVKNALPFDDYHVLTISPPAGRAGPAVPHGSHRSPREHLRRGHIRRLESGSKVWVNATVVNAGIGGKVGKDYRLPLGAA